MSDGLLCTSIDTKFGFHGVVTNKAICFTDIPLNFCDEHTTIYGKFGIGFKKSFVKNCGGNPVSYFVDSHVTLRTDDEIVDNRGLLYFLNAQLFQTSLQIENILANSDGELYDSDRNLLVERSSLEALRANIIHILSFSKQMGDLGRARDDDGNDTFYNEREWRIVPLLQNVISQKVKKNQKEEFNIPFSRQDIRVIIVPDLNIKRKVLDYFQKLIESDDKRLVDFGKNIPTIVIYDELKYF